MRMTGLKKGIVSVSSSFSLGILLFLFPLFLSQFLLLSLPSPPPLLAVLLLVLHKSLMTILQPYSERDFYFFRGGGKKYHGKFLRAEKTAENFRCFRQKPRENATLPHA